MNKINSILVLLIWAISSIAFAQTDMPEPKNDTETRNLETMRLWGEEVWGKGRFDLIPDLVTPEYTRHNADQTRVVTRENYASEIEANRGRQTTFSMNAMSIDNNLLWTRWSGKFTGPNGEEFTFKGIQIYRFENGKLTETWVMQEPGEPWPDN